MPWFWSTSVSEFVAWPIPRLPPIALATPSQSLSPCNHNPQEFMFPMFHMFFRRTEQTSSLSTRKHVCKKKRHTAPIRTVHQNGSQHALPSVRFTKHEEKPHNFKALYKPIPIHTSMFFVRFVQLTHGSSKHTHTKPIWIQTSKQQKNVA